MHLSECFYLSPLASTASNPVQDGSIKSNACLTQWLFRSTSEFHGMDSHINLPWYFGAMCFTYTAGGLAMLVLKPKWTKESYYPYVSFALILAFIQGPLSFLADYMSLTQDSIFHILDRFAALTSLSMELWKIITMTIHMQKATVYCQWAAMIFALCSFIKGQNAQIQNDIYGFIYWHNCWHVYPLLCILIHLFDLYIFNKLDGTSARIDKFENATVLSSLHVIKNRAGKNTFEQRLLHRSDCIFLSRRSKIT